MMAHRSIRRDLLVWLAGGLIIAVAAAAVATYLRAREEANEIFDYQLPQMADSLLRQPVARRHAGRPRRRRRCARRADLGSQRRPALRLAAAGSAAAICAARLQHDKD